MVNEIDVDILHGLPRKNVFVFVLFIINFLISTNIILVMFRDNDFNDHKNVRKSANTMFWCADPTLVIVERRVTTLKQNGGIHRVI